MVLDTGQMISYGQFKQMQYDKLADGLRESMDMEAVYAMLRESLRFKTELLLLERGTSEQ